MPIQRDDVLLERISPDRLSNYLDVCDGDVHLAATAHTLDADVLSFDRGLDRTSDT